MKLIDLLNLDTVKVEAKDKEILSTEIDLKLENNKEAIKKILNTNRHVASMPGYYGGALGMQAQPMNQINAATSTSQSYKSAYKYFLEVDTCLEGVLSVDTCRAILTYAKYIMIQVAIQSNLDRDMVNEAFDEIIAIYPYEDK